MLGRMIHEFARQSINYAEHDYIKTEMFQAVSAKKIFRDAVAESLGGLFVQDYKYYKANGYFDKPSMLTPLKNAGFRFMIKEKFGFDFRTNNSLLNIRSDVSSGDVWRLWGYGQFHDALVLSFFYQFR